MIVNCKEALEDGLILLNESYAIWDSHLIHRCKRGLKERQFWGWSHTRDIKLTCISCEGGTPKNIQFMYKLWLFHNETEGV